MTTRSFQPSPQFTGARVGYYFSAGDFGVGYYPDPAFVEEELVAKRPREEESLGSDDDGEQIEEAVEILTSSRLKSILVDFERRITTNQRLRAKYSDEAEKFMESEWELLETIQFLHLLAASPRLYSVFLANRGMASLLGTVAHENTDISLAAVSLLFELSSDLSSYLEASPNSEVTISVMEDPSPEDNDATVQLSGKQLRAKIASELTEMGEQFLDMFIANNGLELIVANLERLDESTEEDSTGMMQSLGLLESLVEARPSLATALVTQTKIVAWLLTQFSALNTTATTLLTDLVKMEKGQQVKPELVSRLRSRFDPLQGQIAELLVAIIQSDVRVVSDLLARQTDLDVIESFLMTIATSRKRQKALGSFLSTPDGEKLLSVDTENNTTKKNLKDKVTGDEVECLENLYLALSSLLLSPILQKKFVDAEGLELLIRCLSDTGLPHQLKEAMIHGVVTTFQSVVMKSSSACHRFIEVGGLKYLAPALLGKGPLMKNRRQAEIHEMENKVTAILSQCAVYLYHTWYKKTEDNDEEAENAMRLAAKLLENDSEKLKALCQMFSRNWKILEQTDTEIDLLKQSLLARGDQDAYDTFCDEETLYTRRLDGGLAVVQQISILVVFGVLMAPESALEVVESELEKSDVSFAVMVSTIGELSVSLETAAEEMDTAEESKEVLESERTYRDMLRLWLESFEEDSTQS